MTRRNQFCPSTMRVLGIELGAVRPGNKGLYPLSNPASSVSDDYAVQKTSWYHLASFSYSSVYLQL